RRRLERVDSRLAPRASHHPGRAGPAGLHPTRRARSPQRLEASMKVTNPIKPLVEALDPITPGFEAPAPIFFDPKNRRLSPRLRNAARLSSNAPTYVACAGQAAYEYFAASRNLPEHSIFLANALADLLVSGRKAWENLVAAPLTLDSVSKVATEVPAGDFRDKACKAVLDRVYDVAWALRGPP